MAGFPIFTPPSPSPFFDLPKQPDYSAGIAAGISGIGDSFRANRREDFAAQQAADENAYRNAQLANESERNALTAAGGPETWGVNPIYGTQDGNPAGVQLSNRGNVRPLNTPAGFSLTKTPIKLDMGSYFVLVDPITNQPVPGADGRPQILQKDTAGAASLAKQGELQGAAAANLATIEDAQKAFNRDIDAVTNNPNLEFVVGPIYSHLSPEMDIFSGGRQKVSADIQNLIAQTWQQAYDRLKGAGQITEQESAAAKAAINKLSFTSVNVEDYRQYLQEAKDRMAELADLARKKAGAQPMTSAAPPMIAPAPGGAPAAAAPAASGGNDPLGIR